MLKLHPFQNEAEVVSVGALSIENRIDRVTIYGDLDVTRDRAGLANAKALQSCIALIVDALESETDLPETVASPKTSDSVDNPFA